jgi:hypothetical protein
MAVRERERENGRVKSAGVKRENACGAFRIP